MTKLIVGCGYLGRRVAKLWLEDGQAVIGVTRSQAGAEGLKQEGIEGLAADITRVASLTALPEAETVLFAVGYRAASGLSRRDFYVNGLRAVIDSLSPQTQRFMLISSTAVYGQDNGEWVDEDSPCRPKTESGLALLEAESVLAASRFGPCAVILRLAGLYGPGRLLRRANSLLSGDPIAGVEDRYLNLVHVDDAAAIVAGLGEHSKLPRTYILADGHPPKYCSYIAYLAKLLSVADPGFQAPLAAPINQSRHLSNKRVSNARMVAELCVRLRYPTYKEGLKACF